MFGSKQPPHLPVAEGQYVPGSFDLMTEYSPDGCFIRMYYPTSLSDIKTQSSRWIRWLPNEFYVNAFAHVINMWTFLLRLVFKIFGVADFHVPVAWEADLLKDGGKLPVVVFSHGLGACRFFYSIVCLELASRGLVVAAVEHRDKSACTSFFYASPEDRRLDKQTKIQFEKIPLGENHLPGRQRQVRHRALECQRALNLLETLNEGKQIDNILGGQFELSQFKGRLDFTHLVMMGHSFGGATAIRTLGNDSRFKNGIVLDGWMYPVKDDSDLLSTVTQPLLFINTQTFQIPANVAVMQKFMAGATDKTERSGFTIRRSTHEHQTDTPFLVGCWLNLFMRKIDSLTAIRINNQLILRFLQKHAGLLIHKATNEFLKQQEENIACVLII